LKTEWRSLLDSELPGLEKVYPIDVGEQDHRGLAVNAEDCQLALLSDLQ
jgi:hypothetical protein